MWLGKSEIFTAMEATDIALGVKVTASAVIIGLVLAYAKLRHRRMEKENARKKRTAEKEEDTHEHPRCKGCPNEECVCGKTEEREVVNG